MKNNTAILDCITKLITFKFNNEVFTVDIKEGDITDSWNSITDKNGTTWDFNFSWEDDDSCKPALSIYGLIDNNDGTYSTNTSNYTRIKIIGKPSADVYFKEERFEYKFDIESPIIARLYNSKDEEIFKTKSFNSACDELHFAKKVDAKSYIVILATSNNSTKRIY